MNMVPMVAIAGRMNVGKSTLFNRLSTTARAITLDYAGVTRDFIKDRSSWCGVSFDIVDTGGITLRKAQDPLLEKVRLSALSIVKDADVVIFMVDGTVGLMQEDREIASILRSEGKKVVLVINKDDAKITKENQHEFAALGFSDTVLISAQHGTGINDMLDAVIAVFPRTAKTVKAEKPAFKVTLLGKPNVGKSSLMNAILQQERSIVSDIPGTTREALTENILFYKEMIALTDTAGIRRKKAVSGDLEPVMVKSSFHALKEADIIVLVIDVTEAHLADQELKLAFYAFAEHYKALIIVFNKTDLMTDRMREELDRSLDFYKHLMKKVSTLEISCKSGKNVGKLLPLIKEVWQRYSQWLPNEEINRLIISELGRRPLMHQRSQLHVHAVKQVSTAPITVGMAVNEIDWFGPSQLAFFENLLRERYDLQGVPVRFSLRKSFGAKKGDKKRTTEESGDETHE